MADDRYRLQILVSAVDTVANQCCQLRYGIGVEQGSWRQVYMQLAPDTIEYAHCFERVAAKLEKIVVQTDLLNAQYV